MSDRKVEARLRRWFGWSVAAVALLSLAVVGAIGWIGSERALHPAYHRYDWSLSTFPDLHPQQIQVRSGDGIVLHGRFFRGERPALVILASGYGDTQDQMLSIAEFLHGVGFGVITYDSRAPASSGGEYVTLGVREQGDLVSLVEYAARRNDVDSQRIGVLGISMGGGCSISCFKEPSRDGDGHTSFEMATVHGFLETRFGRFCLLRRN